MRVGHIDGKDTVYDEAGRPILREGERMMAQVPNDNIDVSEGTGIFDMEALFDSTSVRGTLYVTDRRILFLRRPNPILAAKDNLYPVGAADAIADAYKAQALRRLGAIEFCEIEFEDVEGFWVKKRTYGVLFLRSPGRGTRKAILYQRGPKDNKLVVLKTLLQHRLPETVPEDPRGSFLLGKRYRFVGKRH